LVWQKGLEGKMKKPSVFRDEKLQQEFDANGFVKFRLLSIEQIKQLHDFYFKTQAAHETVIDERKFHATNDTDNAQLIADADQFIKQVIIEEVEKHFHNYKTIAANYLIKQPGDRSELGPHQDLRFVDETQFYSFNIWVATEPTNKHNGGLRFLKGSHNFFHTIRTLPSYPWKFRDVTDLILENFTGVETEVGDCVVLNHACIHASYPNLSNHIRVAAILAMIPKDADIVHYFLPDGNPANEVEEYAMSLEDFVNLKGGKRPQSAPLIKKFNYDFSAVSRETFLSKLGINNEANKSFVKYGFEYAKQKVSTLFRVAG